MDNSRGVTWLGAYEQLRDEILGGRLSPGDRLIETKIAARLGLSRTPVREALRSMVHDGLASREGGGLRVANRTLQEMLDIYDVRIPLEAAATRGAAKRYTEADMLQMTHSLERMCRVDPKDHDVTTAASRRFHEAIWAAAHNEVLSNALRGLELHLNRYPVTAFRDPDRYEVSMREHRDILEAVRKHDADEAASLAVKHFTEACEIRLRLYSTLG